MPDKFKKYLTDFMTSRRGSAMALALLTMFFLLPTVLYFLTRSAAIHNAATQEREVKAAKELANNTLIDLMRQFSQSYYEGHYYADALTRRPIFYTVGFASMTVIPDELNHSLYVRSTGLYGKKFESPIFKKTLHAVIQFLSPWTDFGTMLDSNFTTGGSNVTYRGKMWINGNWSVTGSNVRVTGGPVFVSGNYSANASTVIDGDLYCTGSVSGGSVVGTVYNFVPEAITSPAIKPDYYSTYYNYQITGAGTQQIVFNWTAGSSTGTFTVVGSTTVAIVPSKNFIIYRNGNLRVRGTLRGRVTLAVAGNVTINGNLAYANGANRASAEDSLAVVASGGSISYDNTSGAGGGGGNLTVCGVYRQATGDMSMNGQTAAVFTMIGTRNQGITASGFNNGRIIEYDENLNRFPPPGLPERPYVVTWNYR